MLQDHEVLIEKKRYELEHRPVQKQVCCTDCICSHYSDTAQLHLHGASCACLSPSLLTRVVYILMTMLYEHANMYTAETVT